MREYLPLVSVLMTVYNREQYIAEAIESVLASSYGNWELVIVDDVSTDRSLEIAREYEANDSRIHVFENKNNVGDYKNRNRAAGHASGKYLKYLDSDDLIYWYGLETMVHAMEQYPEAGMGFSADGLVHTELFPTSLDTTTAIDYHFFIKGILYNRPTGVIYRTDFFGSLKGFDASYGGAADYEFSLRAALKAPIVIFQRDLSWRRQHQGQESHKQQEERLLFTYKILNDRIFNSPQIDKGTRILIRRSYKNSYARKAYIALFKARLREFTHIRKTAELSASDFLRALLPGK